jgi:hypothetical protein
MRDHFFKNFSGVFKAKVNEAAPLKPFRDLKGERRTTTRTPKNIFSRPFAEGVRRAH